MKRFYVYHAGRLIDVVRAWTESGAIRIAADRTTLTADVLYARTTL